MAKYINDNNIDICLMQEPYVTTSGYIECFPRRQMHHKPTRSAAIRSAVVVSATCSFRIEKINDPLSDHFAAIRIITSKATIYLVSIYSTPENLNLLQQNLAKARRVINAAASTRSPVILVGDFNARHSDWQQPYNPHGGELSDWIHMNNIQLLNDTSVMTYHGERGESLVDLTLVNSAAHHRITNWRIDDTFIDSDHKIQRFEVKIGHNRVRKAIYHLSTWR